MTWSHLNAVLFSIVFDHTHTYLCKYSHIHIGSYISWQFDIPNCVLERRSYAFLMAIFRFQKMEYCERDCVWMIKSHFNSLTLCILDLGACSYLFLFLFISCSFFYMLFQVGEFWARQSNMLDVNEIVSTWKWCRNRCIGPFKLCQAVQINLMTVI